MKIKSLPKTVLTQVLADLHITNEKHVAWAIDVFCNGRDQADVASDYFVSKQAVHRLVAKIRGHVDAVASLDNVAAEATFLLPMSAISLLGKFEQALSKAQPLAASEALHKLNAVLSEQTDFLGQTK